MLTATAAPPVESQPPLPTDIGAFPGVNKWTSIGPDRTYINALAMDPGTPTTLYVGTADGVFKSTDGGRIWSTVFAVPATEVEGVRNIGINALAVDPITPTTLYAGTAGILKSTDGGGTWSTVSTGLPYGLVLVVDPLTPTTLYLGTESGMFKSSDAGSI